MDRFTEVGTGEEGMAVSEQQPKLNKITISCETELEGYGREDGDDFGGRGSGCHGGVDGL